MNVEEQLKRFQIRMSRQKYHAKNAVIDLHFECELVFTFFLLSFVHLPFCRLLFFTGFRINMTNQLRIKKKYADKIDNEKLINILKRKCSKFKSDWRSASTIDERRDFLLAE